MIVPAREDPLRRGRRIASSSLVGVVGRLSRYLPVLTRAKKEGHRRISSQEMAGYTNISAAQIRRDLSSFGKFGKRGVGYSVDLLIAEIRRILRAQDEYSVALLGAGRLGQAIASSTVFADHGFSVAAVFDVDRDKIGQPIGKTVVSDCAGLRETICEKDIVVGVLAVPASAAQSVADDLVAAGVKVIFNYSEALLKVPPDVTVRTMNPRPQSSCPRSPASAPDRTCYRTSLPPLETPSSRRSRA